MNFKNDTSHWPVGQGTLPWSPPKGTNITPFDASATNRVQNTSTAETHISPHKITSYHISHAVSQTTLCSEAYCFFEPAHQADTPACFFLRLQRPLAVLYSLSPSLIGLPSPLSRFDLDGQRPVASPCLHRLGCHRGRSLFLSTSRGT